MQQHLAETLRSVHSRAVDQQRVKEDSVALLHLQVHPRVLRVIVTQSVVHLVHATLKTKMSQTVLICFFEVNPGLFV